MVRGREPDFAWLPDGRLSCINRDTPYLEMCIGRCPLHFVYGDAGLTAVDWRLARLGLVLDSRADWLRCPP